MVTEEKSKRIESFDIMETIAIFLVVFCHYTVLSDSVADNFFMTLCFVAVPLFFMVNGALLLHKPFNLKKHIKKIVSVYAVAVVWRIIYLAIALIRSGSVESLISKKQENLSYIFFWTDSSIVATGHMWFMQALLAIYLIFPLLHICFHNGKNGRLALYLLLIVLFVGVFCKTEINVLLSYLEEKTSYHFYSNANFINAFMPYSHGRSLFFFVLGAVLRDKLDEFGHKKGISVPGQKQRIILGGMFLCSWVVMIWTKSLIDGTWSWNGTLYSSGYERIPTVVTTVLLFLLLWNVTIKNNLIKKAVQAVSTYTLGIYYIHWCVLPFVIPLFKVGGVLPNTLKSITAIMISGCIIFAVKYIPLVRRLVK